MNSSNNQNNSESTVTLAVPTMDRTGKRRWIYPDRRGGAYATKRKYTAWVLILIYLIAPWMNINHTPMLRLDVLEKKAFLFGFVFHLNEASLLAPIGATLALLLFFATSLKGRIWCSFSCPQTVFVEWVIRPIEEFVEGNSHHRRRLDAKPLSPKARLRKVIKHGLFLAVAGIVSNTFLAYFFGPMRILEWMSSPPSEHPGPFLVMLFVLGVFYVDFAWFREQFCAFLCPYARFQSVMIDHDTPIVSYDTMRGEPRGPEKRTAQKSQLKGDCIDCQLCVRVCPTGIDIRNGIQLECIQCARCVDACNMVMKNLRRPEGLIRIASQNELSQKSKVAFWKRPKVLAYAVAMILIATAGVSKILTRKDLSLTAVRAPGLAYTTMGQNTYGNVILIRATNNTAKETQLRIRATFPNELEILCGQCNSKLSPFEDVRINVVLKFSGNQINQTAVLVDEITDEEIRMPLLGPKDH